MQEILAKFNTGHLRTVNVRKDFTVSSQSGSTYYDTPEGADPVIEEVGENPGSNSDSNQPVTPQTSKENAPTTT
jgi:hypothetical protein